jgi:hypothetical protein
MHHLHVDESAARVHGVRHTPPGGGLRLCLDPRRGEVAFAITGGINTFRDDEAGGSALRVIRGDEVRRLTVVVRAGAGHRGHHDAVRKFEIAQLDAIKKAFHLKYSWLRLRFRQDES